MACLSESYFLENIKKRKNSSKAVTYDKKVKKFYQEKPFADLTFIIEEKEFLTHKALLAAKCPYFCDMFMSLLIEIF